MSDRYIRVSKKDPNNCEAKASQDREKKSLTSTPVAPKAAGFYFMKVI